MQSDFRSSESNESMLSNDIKDEMLIDAIEQRPALWNFKLPAQKRTPSIKRDLWDEIYNNLGNIKSFYFVLCIYKFTTCGCIDDFVNTYSQNRLCNHIG